MQAGQRAIWLIGEYNHDQVLENEGKASRDGSHDLFKSVAIILTMILFLLFQPAVW